MPPSANKPILTSYSVEEPEAIVLSQSEGQILGDSTNTRSLEQSNLETESRMGSSCVMGTEVLSGEMKSWGEKAVLVPRPGACTACRCAIHLETVSFVSRVLSLTHNRLVFIWPLGLVASLR